MASRLDYDLIVFGDEVPGVLALVAAGREFRRRTQGKGLRSLLMVPGRYDWGVGGHLVRGQLAYLDRTHLTLQHQTQYKLDRYGAPAAIYTEFLRRAGVREVGLDPQAANRALREMLAEVGAMVLDRVQVSGVTKVGDRLTAIALTRGETYTAPVFIDCTVHGELAQWAGVPKVAGWGLLGCPQAALPVSLVFETTGLTTGFLQALEANWIQRFRDPSDRDAAQILAAAATDLTGRRNDTLIQTWRQQFVDRDGQPRTLYVGPDFADGRSPILPILYHAFRGNQLDLQTTGLILDVPNIAILPKGRLSWNALLAFVTATEAEALARQGARPSPKLLNELTYVARWLQSLAPGVTVKPAPELYIRYAGSVADVVAPLSGAQLLAGGLPAQEALGTFGYKFDVRGGIPGLGHQAIAAGFRSLSFLAEPTPVFNYGIGHALVKSVANLAIVSPAGGYVGIAPAAGRIVELNCGVGQGVGIAAAIALHQGRDLRQVTTIEVRQVLAATRQLPTIYGYSQAAAAQTFDRFEQALRPTTPVWVAGLGQDQPTTGAAGAGGSDTVTGTGGTGTATEKGGTGSTVGTGSGSSDKGMSKDQGSGTGSAIAPPLPALVDVGGHWAEPFIQSVRDRRVLIGFDDRTFRPQNSFSRAEFAVVITKAFQRPAQFSSLSYTDVPADHWAAQAIAKAGTMGFLSVFSLPVSLPIANPSAGPIATSPQPTAFRPNAKVTRAEMIAAIARGLGLKAADTASLDRFVDRAAIPAALVIDLAAATERHLVVNSPQGSTQNSRPNAAPVHRLRPQQEATRAEWAATLHQAWVAIGQSAPINSPQISQAPVSNTPTSNTPTSNNPTHPPLFTDLTTSGGPHWAQPFIEALVTAEIITGYGDRTFRPDLPLSRGQLAALLVQAFDPAPRRPSRTFPDLPANHWAAGPIDRAYRAGFLSGLETGEIAPDAPLPRLQVWLALASGLGWPGAPADRLAQFSDAAGLPVWAQGAVAAACQRRAIVTYPEPSRLEASNLTTRAAACAIVYQALLAEARFTKPIASIYIAQPLEKAA